MKSYRKRTGAKKDKLNEPDEFLSLTQRALFYAQENTTKFYAAIAVVVVIAFVAVGGSYLMRKAGESAQMRLNEAMQYYDIESPSPGDAPMDAGERIKKAREMFKELAGKSGPVGMTASYYEANAAMELGDMDAAVSGYNAVIAKASSDPVLASLAYLRLAEAYRYKGDGNKAMETLDTLEKLPGGGLKDEARFRIAGMLMDEGKTDQALAGYKKLVEEFPDSPWKSEAEMKIAQLGGGSPAGMTQLGVPAGAVPVQVTPGEGGKPATVTPMPAAPKGK